MRCPATSPTGWTCSTATRRPRSRPTVLAREVARASSSSSAIATSRTQATTTTAATARRRKSTSGARKIRSSARLPISFRPALPSRSSKRCARLSATRSRRPSRRPRASRIRVLRTRRRTCTPRTIRFRMERARSTAALVVALVLLLGACTAAKPSASPTPAPATRGGGGWAFALAPTPAQLARSVLDDATLRSVLSTDLVVSDESTTAIGERIALTNELARRRVTANVITVTPTDATQKLRPLLVTTPIVFLAGTPRSYVEAARTVTVGTSLYLSYLCDFSDIGDLHEAAALVVWPGSRWIAASSSGASGAARAAFVQAYTDRTGPPTSLAASAYDALGLVASAAEGGTAPSDVRDRLQSGTFTGVATTYAFSPSQHAGFNAGDLALLRYVGLRTSPALR